MLIPLHDLREATKGFSVDTRIGTGGYGDVYKGVYDGREVAVKLLRVDVAQGIDDQAFLNEVSNLLRVKHPNVVELLGYCYETASELVQQKGKQGFSKHIYRVLCFEYLQGGNLNDHLHEKSHAPDWSTQYNIIKGTCEGLNFLHGCKPAMFHLDLKPANILLDSYMMPKVADFGLSRVMNEPHTHVTEHIKGTKTYMPPEYINGGSISNKNDVFSLGVVMIEIISGSLDYSSYIEVDKVTQFKQKIYNDWQDRIKARSEYPEEEMHQVQMCIDTAMSCVEPNRDNRPTIGKVLDILNETETHIPKRQLADVPSCSIVGPSNTMATTLEDMAAELDNITNQHSSSMSGKSSNVHQVIDIRETTSDVEELIIGRTEEIKEIVATLCESITPGITILPIYGFGGIGKTTLARLLYNDSEFAGYSLVWVYVSQNLDLKKISNSIISQLSEESHLTEKQMIHNKLRKVLADKKILIVLDDVWEENPDTLNSLKAMLRLGEGSNVRIIVTTRDETIAREICHTVEPYKLGTLTDKICWKIIKQKAAFKNRVDKKQLKHIGWEIATKCGGLALAAQSLGYTVKDKGFDIWESVRDSDIWNLSNLKDPSSTVHKVHASLLLSYIHMPDWLKLCFSYCAVFPKGHGIRKYDLIHQWIALGFTEQSNIFDPMQLCESYITKLVRMSFLQYSKTHWRDTQQDKDVIFILQSDVQQGKDDTLFTMHDLVHDLAKQILARQIDARGNKCRYALLTDCSESLQLSVTFPANIKALHFRNCGKRELCGGAFSPAKCLRVLDLSECFIEKLPDCIGQMKQLRFLYAPPIQDKMIPNCITELSELNYLNIRYSCNISALPESIGDMKGLMHLDLSGCNRIHELPVSFPELKQLVHLDLSNRCMHISEALGGFTKLQYLNLSVGLTWYSVLRTNVLQECIGNLIQLRYLNLSRCMDIFEWSTLLDSISTLSSLEHLDLSKNDGLCSIPESIDNLTKLHTLDISGCRGLYKLPDSIVKMASLKILIKESWSILDKSTLSELYAASLPHFVVHASSETCNSNIILLQPTNPVRLMIDRLENVQSAEEAQCIKLIEKQNIEVLTFAWREARANLMIRHFVYKFTKYFFHWSRRFVDDKDVLEKLVPPSSVRQLNISGYRSVSIPDWLMDIGQYLPNLTYLYLCNFPKCNKLPPLGQLRNLQDLSLSGMESLEEWNMAYTSREEAANELMFHKLKELAIFNCPRLRIKPCLPELKRLTVSDSDNVLSSWGESSSHNCASPSPSITDLTVYFTKVPMHKWRLLQHLPALRKLTINCCSDVNTPSEVFQCLSSLKSLTLNCGYNGQAELPRWLVELTSLQQLEIDHPTLQKLNEDTRTLSQLQSLRLSSCGRMTILPEWLGELTSLRKLEIENCEGIRSLPDSIEQLTKLKHLRIEDCPTLMKWCKSEENKMKLAHIKDKLFLLPSNYNSNEEDIADEPDEEDIADGSSCYGATPDDSDEEDMAETFEVTTNIIHTVEGGTAGSLKEGEQ